MTELNSRENDPRPTERSRSETDSLPVLTSEITSESSALEIQDLVEEAPADHLGPDTPAASAVLVDSPPNWYLGISEAMGWLFGAWLVHVIAAVFIVILLIISNVAMGKARPMDFDDPNSMMIITAGEMTLFVLAAILTVSLRFWGRLFNELNFTPP